MTLARAWEAAEPQGFPPEVASILASSAAPELTNLSALIAIPEYQVALPGGDRPSQTDVLAIARGEEGLVTVAVEGKVDEAFGPTVSEKHAEGSQGVEERLQFLAHCLELPTPIPGPTRYQLLHRTASALLAAELFCASAAVMLVHSFSPSNKWFEDFEAFASLFEVEPKVGKLAAVGERQNIPLFLGWCRGDQRFRQESGV